MELHFEQELALHTVEEVEELMKVSSTKCYEGVTNADSGGTR